MKVIKLTLNEKGSSSVYFNEDNLENFLDDFELGQIGTFEIIEMSRSQFNSLPPFEGF